LKKFKKKLKINYKIGEDLHSSVGFRNNEKKKKIIKQKITKRNKIKNKNIKIIIIKKKTILMKNWNTNKFYY